MHRERYGSGDEAAGIARYNEAMAAFNARERTGMTAPWTIHSARRVAGPEALSGRDRLLAALRRMGFMAAEG